MHVQNISGTQCNRDIWVPSIWFLLQWIYYRDAHLNTNKNCTHYPPMHKITHQYTKVPTNTQKYPSIHKTTHPYTKVPTNTQNNNQYTKAGVNQRPKVNLYSGLTSMVIISLPGQPYHIIDFSFIFKHEFSEYIRIFVKNHKFGL